MVQGGLQIQDRDLLAASQKLSIHLVAKYPGHLCAAQYIIAWHASQVTGEKMGVGMGT